MKQYIIAAFNKLKGTKILANFFNLSSIQISNVVLLLLTIRVVTVNAGIEGFGLITFAYRFAMLAGTVVNYGTNQSGVRDTAYNLTDTQKLSAVFFNALLIRAIIFILYLIGLGLFYELHADYYLYLLLSTPVVLAEVFNPLCFFIGCEKLRIFNLSNLALNFLALLFIFIFIKSPAEGCWVNFILGMGNVVTYAGLIIYFKRSYKLTFSLPLKKDLLKILKDNFYLTTNNISANLQQSIIIIALKLGNSNLLGAYTLCDRVIGQCRNLLNTFGNAVYPKAVHLYKQSTELWKANRKKIKRVLTAGSLAGGLIVYVLADFIVYTLSKEHDANTIMLLRIMAFVPVVSASNVINIVDMLIKNNTVYIFRISAALFVISGVLAFALVTFNNYLFIGGFTFIVEGCALVMSEYFIKKPSLQNA